MILTCPISFKANIYIFVSVSGKVYAMGRKEYGRLGVEVQEDLQKPTVIPTLEDIRCVGISCGSAVSFSVSEDGEKISLKLKQPFFYSNRF